MRWLAKAAVQKGFGVLPQGERLNYVFQRRVLRSLPAGDGALRQKFSRALQHLGAYEEHGPGVPATDATFYEFGAGWDLAIPVAYALLGVGRQVLVDIRPSARVELVNDSLASYERLRGELEGVAGRELRPLGGPISQLEELEDRFGIRYLAPCDARGTGLPDKSIEFVSSTDTCEHIPGVPAAPSAAGSTCRTTTRTSTTRCRSTTSCATPTARGASSTRRSTTRTASARPSTCSWCATRASSSRSRSRPGRVRPG